MAQTSKRTWTRTNQANELEAAAAKGVTQALAGGYGQAASAYNDSLNQGLGELGRLYSQADDQIRTGYGQAQDRLDTAYGTSLGAIGQGFDNAQNALTSGYNTGRTSLASIGDLYQPFYDSGKSASAMYTNALGLNGAAGNKAATDAFQASPGYEWQVNQATDAALRKANASGLGASGNTLASLATLGQGLANQEWGGYLDRLSGQQAVGMQAATGIDNARRGLAAYDYGYGQDTANLAARRGTTLADLGTAFGNNSANLATGQATRLADLSSSLGTQNANLRANQGTTLANLGQNLADKQAGFAFDSARTIGDRMIKQGEAGDSAANANDSILGDTLGSLGGTLLSGVTGGLGSLLSGGTFLGGLGSALSGKK